MAGEAATDRSVFEITGEDRLDFLQGLITNDIRNLDRGLVYAALLTPQGKYLADFFLLPSDGGVLLDVKTEIAAQTIQRLSMYKLRANVGIGAVEMPVARGLGPVPQGAFADPRHPALGWRAYGVEGGRERVDWDSIRVKHVIPETGIELIPNETFLLETGFERLNGVDFRKGCYVGQEVTARMKHKTQLRKGLAKVAVTGEAPAGTAITADGKPAGTLFTQSGGYGIAYLRYDRAMGDMQAGDAGVRITDVA